MSNMSKHDDVQGHDIDLHEDDGMVHVHVHPASTYVKIFGALVFLTLLTVGLSRVHLGEWNFFIAVVVATIKASLVALFFSASHALFAQTTGRIQGQVVDAQGAVVPGVTVTITSPALQGSLTQVSDAGALQTLIQEVIAANPAQLETYRKGKSATFGWFVGQVMKRTGGRANPQLVNELLKKALGP